MKKILSRGCKSNCCHIVKSSRKLVQHFLYGPLRLYQVFAYVAEQITPGLIFNMQMGILLILSLNSQQQKLRRWFCSHSEAVFCLVKENTTCILMKKYYPQNIDLLAFSEVCNCITWFLWHPAALRACREARGREEMSNRSPSLCFLLHLPSLFILQFIALCISPPLFYHNFDT